MEFANKDPSVLNIETVMIIIEFKWRSYAKKFFIAQLIVLLIFVLAFIVDIAAIADNPAGFDVEDTK